MYIGLMSGTSADGVDGVLADFSSQRPQVLAHHAIAFDGALRGELLALNRAGDNELHRAALAANALMRAYADVVHGLLARAQLDPAAVRAIGAHGQTVRHRPGQFDRIGYTTQLAHPALLAELTGIDVVADFRSRDVAAGGQGAPLAPLFHRAWLAPADASMKASVGVLNLGGISNLTLLRPGGVTIGFDCGPANALMDEWCEQHRGRRYDDGGAWAASGRVDTGLLQDLLAEPYFGLPPPKSTGRDLFNRAWLDARLARRRTDATDVQATLAELSARCVADAVGRHEPGLHKLVVCGGGAHNRHLMARLQALLPGTAVADSSAHGLPPLQVEAAAFAWLAKMAVERRPLPLEMTTGARGARVLGCIYPR